MGAGLCAGRAGPRASESNVIGAVFENIRLTSGTKSWSQRRRCWQARSNFRLNGWKLFCWQGRRSFGVRSGGIGPKETRRVYLVPAAYFQAVLLARGSEALVPEAAKAFEKKSAESSSSRLIGWKLFCWLEKWKLCRQKRRNRSKRNLLSSISSG